jgi:hypothetical protein
MRALWGDSLTYADSLDAAQATTFVLPDEAGRGVMLAAESWWLHSEVDVAPRPHRIRFPSERL